MTPEAWLLVLLLKLGPHLGGETKVTMETGNKAGCERLERALVKELRGLTVPHEVLEHCKEVKK